MSEYIKAIKRALSQTNLDMDIKINYDEFLNPKKHKPNPHYFEKKSRKKKNWR